MATNPDPNNVVWHTGGQQNPDELKAQALDFFMSNKWTPAQAGGIVANFDHESAGFNPNAIGDGGASFGLGQWNGPRKEALFGYAASKGEKLPSFFTQLEFAQKELTEDESDAGARLRSARTIEDATKIFSDHFERPSKPLMESRLKRAADIAGKFLGPSAAFASEGPDPSNVEWHTSGPDPKNVEWHTGKDKTSFTQKLMEEISNPKFTPSSDALGVLLGTLNSATGYSMLWGAARELNAAKQADKRFVPRSPESLAQDKIGMPPEQSRLATQEDFAQRLSDMGPWDQFAAGLKGGMKATHEAVAVRGTFGPGSEEGWKLGLGKPLEQALPEGLKWAAPAIIAMTDILGDPGVGYSVAGKKMYDSFAKGVMGGELYKSLSEAGAQFPDLKVHKFHPQVLDDIKKLDALDVADKKEIRQQLANAIGERLKYRQWQEEILPKLSAQDEAYSQRLDNPPIQRGVVEPSKAAGITPQEIDQPAPVRNVMEQIEDSIRLRQAQPAGINRLGLQPQVQRGTVTPSPVADVVPTPHIPTRTLPPQVARVVDTIEDAQAVERGFPVGAKQAQTPQEMVQEIVNRAIAAKRGEQFAPPQAIAREVPEPVQRIMQLAEEAKARKQAQVAEVLPEPIRQQVVPEVAGTRTGPTFDTAMRKPVKYPEPGAAASSITDSHMVNAETMGQVEQRILSGNKGIREELGRIYDTRVKAEGEAGGETFKDWMNPQKVGSRIHQELRKQGVPHKEAMTRLKSLMKDYEVKYKDVLDTKSGEKKAPEMIATEKGVVPQKAVDQSLVDQLRADLDVRKGAEAKQPWDTAKDEWLRSHGRGKDKTIWMYRVSGKEYHGGKTQEGLYVTRDLDFAGTFVTPESKLQLVKVKESALMESPEGARRGANLLQESMVKPSDIIESKEFKVRSKTYEGARAEIKDPHAMAIRDAAEKAIAEGMPIPEEVLKKHPELAAKAKGAPDVPKEVQGKQGTKGPLDILKSEKGAVTLPPKGPSDKAIHESLKNDPDYKKFRAAIGEKPDEKGHFPTSEEWMTNAIDRFWPARERTPETYEEMRMFSSKKDEMQFEFDELWRDLKNVRYNRKTFSDLVALRRMETRSKMFKESATKPSVANAQKIPLTGPVKPGQKQYKWFWQVENPGEMSGEESTRLYKKLMDEYVAKGGNKKHMEDALDTFHEWTRKKMLDEAHRTGFISDEQYANIIASNDFYATFRIIKHMPDVDDIPRLNTREYFSLANQDIIMPIKGTTEQMIDPVEATIGKFMDTKQKVAKNDIVKHYFDEILTNPDITTTDWARPIPTNMNDFVKMQAAKLQPFPPDAKLPPEWGKVSFFRNGEVEHWAIPSGQEEMLKGGLNEVSIPAIIRISNETFKKGVTTANLPFAITQMMRDTVSAFNQTDAYKWYHLFGPYQADLVRGYASGFRQEVLSKLPFGIGEAIGPSPRVIEAVKGGAGLGFFSEMRSPKVAADRLFKQSAMDATVKELGGIVVRKMKDIPSLLLFEIPGAAVSVTEHGPRLASYYRTLKATEKARKAGMASRNSTVDFFRAGKIGRIVNQVLPFTNARVQGKYNVAYNTILKKEGKADAWAKILTSVFIPGLSAWIWNNVKYREHYKNLDTHTLDNYVPLIFGEHKDEETGKMQPDYLAFPKDDVMHFALDAFENVLNAMSDTHPRETKELMTDVLFNIVSPFQVTEGGEIAPGKILSQVTPPLAKAVIEPITNTNLWTMRDVDPKWMEMENVPSHLRGSKRTPDTYKWASKKIYEKMGWDWSPNKMQNIGSNLVGGYGKTGMDPSLMGKAITERVVKTRATGNINRAAKIYYAIDKDYQQLRYTAIDMVKNGKRDEARQMLNTWNQNLGTRLADMEKFGYKDKGGARRDYKFSSEKISNIIKKGRESDKPKDWLDERLKRRQRRQ